MVTVHVVNSNGKPVAKADVQISWRESTHSTGRTDNSGSVSWNVSNGSGTIYLDGWEVYDGEIDDSVTVQIH